jgi:hypothetical protein
MTIDTALTPTVVQLEKKSGITADYDPLSCEIDFSISLDVPGRYPSLLDQADLQRQKKPHHYPCTKSEYHDGRYNPNTDSGSDRKEKLHHSR